MTLILGAPNPAASRTNNGTLWRVLDKSTRCVVSDRSAFRCIYCAQPWPAGTGREMLASTCAVQGAAARTLARKLGGIDP